MVIPLLPYRLARYIDSCRHDRPLPASETKRVLTAAGVVDATWKKVGRKYLFSLKLSNGLTLFAESADRAHAWIDVLVLLQQHLLDQPLPKQKRRS